MQEQEYRIGGSDSPIILGVSPFKKRRELWLEKRGYIEPTDTQTPAMKRGTVLEPVVADMYAEMTGRTLLQMNLDLKHKKYDWMQGHVDRLIKNGKKNGVLEIKCPGLQVFSRCKREGLPSYYMIQLQHYFSVVDTYWGAIAVFNAERWEMIHFDVERDNDLIGQIIEYDQEFLQSLKGEMPEEWDEEPAIDLPDIGSSKLIKIETPEWKHAVNELREAKQLVDEAEEIEADAKENIINYMQGHEIAEGAGCRVYHQTHAGRKTFDKNRLVKEHPEIDLSAYQKEGKPYRSFRPYFLKERYHE